MRLEIWKTKRCCRKNTPPNCALLSRRQMEPQSPLIEQPVAFAWLPDCRREHSVL